MLTVILCLMLPAILVARIVPEQLDLLVDEDDSSGNGEQVVIENEEGSGKQINELFSGDHGNYSLTNTVARLDNPNYFEGDIIATKEQIIEAYGPDIFPNVSQYWVNIACILYM